MFPTHLVLVTPNTCHLSMCSRHTTCVVDTSQSTRHMCAYLFAKVGVYRAVARRFRGIMARTLETSFHHWRDYTSDLRVKGQRAWAHWRALTLRRPFGEWRALASQWAQQEEENTQVWPSGVFFWCCVFEHCTVVSVCRFLWRQTLLNAVHLETKPLEKIFRGERRDPGALSLKYHEGPGAARCVMH